MCIGYREEVFCDLSFNIKKLEDAGQTSGKQWKRSITLSGPQLIGPVIDLYRCMGYRKLFLSPQNNSMKLDGNELFAEQYEISDVYFCEGLMVSFRE